MKAGDKYPVTIAGQVVAHATLKEVGDGTATLVVPGTVVVMATRTDLADTPQSVDSTGTETIIDGVERTSGEPVGESATVSDTSDTTVSTEPTNTTEVAQPAAPETVSEIVPNTPAPEAPVETPTVDTPVESAPEVPAPTQESSE